MAEDIRIITVEIPGPAGLLEGIINAKAEGAPRAIAVLAHPLPPEGGTLHTKCVFHVAKAFARIDCPVLRFNFRGVGRSAGTFSGGPGEKKDFRAAGVYDGSLSRGHANLGRGHVLRRVGGDDGRCGGSPCHDVDRHCAAGDALRFFAGDERR